MGEKFMWEAFFPLLEIINNLPRLSVKIKQLREGFTFFGLIIYVRTIKAEKFNILSHLHD